MVTSRPAHVLGDVVGEFEESGEKFYQVLVQHLGGRTTISFAAKFVLVGDELEDLYDDEIEEIDE